MSPDNLDSFIVKLADWIDRNPNVNLDDDFKYDELTELVYSNLDKFCTQDRNYN